VKIVVVSDVSPVQLLGGGERVLWEQTSRLSARKHVVKVVSRTPDGGVPGDLVHGGVAVHHFPVDRRSLAAFIRTSVLGARRAVESEIVAHGADVLHFHQPIGAFGVLTSTLGRRLPSLYTFHSPAPLEYRSRTGMSGLHRGGLVGRAGAALLWTLERASLKRASRIQVLSDFSARLLWDLYGISGERIVKIVGGADVERFHPGGSREAQRQALGLPSDRPLLFTLRNLEPRMGLDTLIRAMATVRERFPRVLLLIGGSGSLRSRKRPIPSAIAVGPTSAKSRERSSGSRISGVAPTGVPRTGVPHASASTVARPNPSSSRVGNTNASAAP